MDIPHENREKIIKLEGKVNELRTELKGSLEMQALHSNNMSKSAEKMESAFTDFVEKTSESVSRVHQRIDFNERTTVENKANLINHIDETRRNTVARRWIIGTIIGVVALIISLSALG